MGYGDSRLKNTIDNAIVWLIILSVCALAVGLCYGGIAAYQPFKVWAATYTVEQERLVGEAEFVRAEQSRRILVEQARAEKDSAILRAEAIEIVGQAAKDFPEYRYQEFLGAFGEAFRDGNIDQIVYVPTEGMIPVMEAGRAVQ